MTSAIGWSGLLAVGIAASVAALTVQARARRRTSTFPQVAVAATTVYLMYRLHVCHLPADWHPAIRAQIFNQGIIPYLILAFTAFGAVSLLQIHAVYDRYYWTGQREAVLERLSALYSRDGDIAAVQRLRDDILDDHERTIHLAFTTVRYTEWVLPLFGFLGTVIGLGMALGHMQSAVQFGREGVVITPDQLNKTFAGMALSFYTTLLGLLGMLALAFGHVWLRSHVERNIAEFSNGLTAAIERAPNQPSTVKVVEIPDSKRMVRALHELSRQQTETTNLLRRCLREDTVLYARFGPILFERFAGSSANYTALAMKVQDEISRRLDAPWHIRAVTGTTGDGDRCAMLIDVDGSTALCTFDVIAGDNAGRSAIGVHTLAAQFDRMIGCNRTTVLIRSKSDDRLHWWTNGTTSDAQAVANDSDLLIPVPASNGAAGVVLVAGAAQRRHAARLAREGTTPIALATEQPINWKVGAVSPHGRFLALAGPGSTDGGVHLTLVDLRARAAADALISDIQIRAVENVTEIFWLSNETLGLLAADGGAWLFDTGVLQEPAPLDHAKWRRAPCTWIVSGTDGWFAALESRSLSMWRVTAAGELVPSPNGERVQVNGIEESCVAAIGGHRHQRRLVAGLGNTITVWDYPRDATRWSGDTAAAART